MKLIDKINESRWVKFSGWVVGIAGLLVAWFTYERRDLRWMVNPVRSVIVRQAQITDLKVTVKGIESTNDLSAVQVQIWNNGSKAIRHADIIRPVRIVFDGPIRFIEVSVRNSTRPDIVNLVNKGGGTERPNAIELDWNILEKNDGALIQLIYDGPVTVPVHIEGAFEGQREIHLGTSNKFLAGGVWMPMAFLVVLATISGMIDLRQKPTGIQKVMALGYLMIALAFVGIMLWRWLGTVSPPFPF